MGAVVTLLKLSCDKNGHDYCLSDWQKVGDIFNGVNNTLSQNYSVSSCVSVICFERMDSKCN